MRRNVVDTRRFKQPRKSEFVPGASVPLDVSYCRLDLHTVGTDVEERCAPDPARHGSASPPAAQPPHHVQRFVSLALDEAPTNESIMQADRGFRFGMQTELGDETNTKPPGPLLSSQYALQDVFSGSSSHPAGQRLVLNASFALETPLQLAQPPPFSVPNSHIDGMLADSASADAAYPYPVAAAVDERSVIHTDGTIPVPLHPVQAGIDTTHGAEKDEHRAISLPTRMDTSAARSILVPARRRKSDAPVKYPVLICAAEGSDSVFQWGFSSDVLAAVDLVTLYPWQTRCLRTPGIMCVYPPRPTISIAPSLTLSSGVDYTPCSVGTLVESPASLVYSAPTSAGKSLIATLLMFRRLFDEPCSLHNAGPLAIFAVPTRSLADQKVADFKGMLCRTQLKCRVVPVYGSLPVPSLHERTILVATFERAHNIIDSIVESRTLLPSVCNVVVDELHYVGNESRGASLETLLVKIMFLQRHVTGCRLQLIGMSATIPNLRDVGKWLGAHVYEESAFRPVKLEEGLFVAKNRVSAGGMYTILRSASGITRAAASDDTPPMEATAFVEHKCLAAHGTGMSVIVFAPTRAATQQMCKVIGEKYASKFGLTDRQSSATVMSNRAHLAAKLTKQGYPAGNIPAVMHGVACHHAGLTEDARDAIQVAFQNSILMVIVATSTLAEGVNLPANLVLFSAPRVGQALIGAAQYAQMSGRAGRAGLATRGESIVCVKDEPEADAFLLNLQEEAMPVRSQISVSKGATATSTVARLVLDGLARKYCSTDEPWATLMFNTELSAPVCAQVHELLSRGFVRMRTDGSMNATATGEAVSRSGIDVQFAIRAYSDLSATCASFFCGTLLQMLYICCPVDFVDSDKLAWDDFDTLVCMCKRNDTFAQAFLDSLRYSPQIGNLIFCNKTTFMKEDRINHCRLFVSCVLYLCLLQVPGFDCRKYGVADFMATITAFGTCAGRLATFAECLRWWSIAAAAKKLKRHMRIQPRMVDIQRQLGLTFHEVCYFSDNKLRSPGDVVRLGLAGLRALCRSSLPFQPSTDATNGCPIAFLGGQSSAWHGLQCCNVSDLARADTLHNLAVKCIQKNYEADEELTEDDSASDASVTTTSSQSSEEPVEDFAWEPVTDAPRADEPMFAELDRTVWQDDDTEGEPGAPLEDYMHSVPLPSYEKLNFFDSYISHSQLRGEVLPVTATPTGDRHLRATAGWFVGDAMSSLKASAAIAVYTHPNVQSSAPSWIALVGSSCDSVFVRLCPSPRDAGPVTWQALVCEFLGVPAVQVISECPTHPSKAGFAASSVAFVSKDWEAAWQRAWHRQMECVMEAVQAIVDACRLVFVNNVVETISHLHSCNVHLHPLRTLDARAAAWMLTGSANMNDFAVEDLKRRYWTMDTRDACALDADLRLLLPNFTDRVRGVRRSKAGQQAKDALDHTKDIYACGVALSLLLKQQRLTQPFQHLEMPFLFALATIKRNGLQVDLKTVQSQYDSVHSRLERVKKRISDLAQLQGWTGVPFNLESGSDVRWLLDTMNAGRPVERNPRACCSAAFLEKLHTSSNGTLKFVAALVQESTKLFNVFRSVSALRQAALAGNNGRLSCQFNTLTATGRVIVSLPALQGLPKSALVSKVAIQDLQDELMNRAPLAELMKHPKCQVLLYTAAETFDLYPGRVIRVLHDRTIGDPPAEPVNADTTPLAMRWNDMAACYEQKDYGNIVQTVIDLYAANTVRRLTVPADKVYRDVARRVLPEDCTNTSVAFAREWRTPTQIYPRNAIIATSGCILVAADYSQIEVRMLAHLSRDPALMKAVRSDNDIFKGIASQKHDEKISLWDNIWNGKQETCAGSRFVWSYYDCHRCSIFARDLRAGIHETEASHHLLSFRATFSVATKFFKNVVEQCRRLGFVETLLHRRRMLPDITSEDPRKRSSAERQAVNSVCQGSAADVLKLAVWNFQCELNEKGLESFARIILLIHDEVLVEVHEACFASVRESLQRHLETVCDLLVPLKVKLSVGPTWGSLEELSP